MIVSSVGRLYRIDLDRDRPTLEHILIDPLCSSNGEHGVSPDGQYLALSDRSSFGKEMIYIMRLEDLVPIRQIANAPSWFHGWSPDGNTITYAGQRNGLWIIGCSDTTGGPERIIAQADPGSGHQVDAPEFSADGAWIWFCSNRGGSMALWRVRPDGTGEEQMTRDTSADWFPHPSPDGQHVCYLSYAAGTEDHPFGQDIELRLISAEGGTHRKLLRVKGGHGTFNSPCWAPDSQRFVFIRYRQGLDGTTNAGPQSGSAG
ncbi:MAG: hypothetical protein AAGF79_07035 [Pseudomonadota bacterium]